LEFLMKRNGHDVKVVSDGEAVLNAVAEFAPDVILLDVMMPRLNGFEVCQRLRENPAWDSIRIIMLTAKGRDVDVTKGLAVGADAYVTKPFSTRELVDKVEAMARG
ncbi:MAG TPA: response regulator, partial [Casimicrobiaceae bacterium]|nr:response regulator [Casimicrobiaceae bacterium]